MSAIPNANAAAGSAVAEEERALQAARVAARIAAWRAGDDAADALSAQGETDAADRAASALPGSRLTRLGEVFGLSALERDIVATLWVLAYAPAWRSVVASLDAGGSEVSALAVSAFFAHPPRARLAGESPLLLWRIVEEQATLACGNPALALDAHLLGWLDGAAELDRQLVGLVRLLGPASSPGSWPVQATAARLRQALPAGERVRVQVLGSDPNAACAFASAVAARVGMPVLAVAPGCVARGAAEGGETFVRLQRQAFLDGCAPLFDAADAGAAWPTQVAWFPLHFAMAETPLARALPAVRDIVVTLDVPTPAERRALWLASMPAAAHWDAGALDELAQRHRVQPSDIAAAAATMPATPRDAAAALRERSRGELGPLAHRLECPFTWDDLVLPPAVREPLRDIAFEARDRTAFWEQAEAARLYPQGRGLIALFCGPPGTGKTMAAQVIAAELELDLYRVDLSAVISKWVGETAQNLQRVLARAAERELVLFFDEADALYGKRVEDVRNAQDRFANMDLSHLMVAIESYRGIVLLASNLRGNIDPAFIRRIRHCIEFPRPDAAARREIWARVARVLWNGARLDGVLDALAAIETSGAQIKSAALSAAFAARRLGGAQGAPTRRMLVEALSRELAKDGAGLSARAIEQLTGRDAVGNGDA